MQLDDALRGELARSFEVVHVNYSKENTNADVMARLGNPERRGFPVILVLSPRLAVLHTQDTVPFEAARDGKPGYDTKKILSFLRNWRLR